MPIGELVKPVRSWNPQTNGEGRFDYIDLSSVDKAEKKILSVETIECKEAPSRARQLVAAGDILVATVRPNLNGVAMAFDCHDGMTASTGYTVLRPDPSVLDGKYLFHWVKTPRFIKKMVDVAAGANYPAVSDKKVKESEIPLPPLPEQKRIAKILDAADALRAKRRESLAQLDALLQSTFLEMFGDPVENPKGWPLHSLPKLALHFCDGPFGSNLKSSHYVEDGVRVIRLQNIGVGELLDHDLAFISEEHYQSLPRNHCRPGDVVIGTLGDPNLRACVIPESLPESLNKADCLLFRPNPDRVLSSYVSWLLNCPALVASSAGLVRGQTRGRISLGRLKTMRVPTPPLAKQMEFDQGVNRVKDHQSALAKQVEELDALFDSLQQSAFAGQL